MFGSSVFKTIATVAIAWGAVAFGPVLPAQAAGRNLIEVSQTSLAPFSYIRFCRTNPEECRSGGAKSVEMTDETDAILDGVNRRINRSIRGTPEAASKDEWQVGTKSGDCEDYALTKRQELVKWGFPPSSLRLAVAFTRQGEGHAVLVVRTSRGDLVLDNRFMAIKVWNKTDLNWQKIASADNPKIWYTM